MAGAGGIGQEEFQRLFERLSNSGRFGSDDERGTLNFIGPQQVASACALVRDGRSVSLGRPLDTVPSADNPKPALHYMAALGDRSSGEPKSYTDFIAVDFHGKSASHLDALCHMSYRGQLYNGRAAAEAVGSTGASFGAITALAEGIVTRGVLLDAAAAEGKDWLEPPLALEAEELAAIAARLGVELRRGDAVLLRSGAIARRARLGVWNPDEASVGLAPGAVGLLAESQAALLGSDADSDARPSGIEGIASPIHALTLCALGMPLLDNLDLEALSTACAAAGRYEFLLVVAPLIVPGGTGSPANPIAVF